MSGKLLLCLLLAPLSTVQLAIADGGERAAILAVMDQAFAAVASRDPDDMRALQLANGTSISFRPDPNGQPGELKMRMSANETLVASEVDDGRAFRERWIGEPTVAIRGPIAHVWGEYEFLIDGAVSHCGIDSVGLVKLDGYWKIANWTWTVEPEKCPTGP